ncbi:hypothetical protein GF319_03015 [Candidatus Bathyarchaeota archaeon]|nr:hypothetical protein [Candidatus Bathyarchaeota archaeon]
MIVVKDLTLDNIEDVFRICSRNRLNDPLQEEGICIKREWLLEMLEEIGPITKIGYYNEEPSAQVMFYPEKAVPYIPFPREMVLRIECIYNSNPEAQGKGIGSELIENLKRDARTGMDCLGGESPEFIVVNVFNTGEGISMEEFYLSKGFKRGKDELFYEIKGKYYPSIMIEYENRVEDKNKALIFYDRNCEYSYTFAKLKKETIMEIKPDLEVILIDVWKKPSEFASRGGNYLIINSVPIDTHIGNREEFVNEVQIALENNF